MSETQHLVAAWTKLRTSTIDAPEDFLALVDNCASEPEHLDMPFHAAADRAEVKRLREECAELRRREGDIVQGRLADLELWKKDRDALVAERDALQARLDEIREGLCPA